MAKLSKEDLILIESCFREKGWRGAKLCREFRSKKWNRRIVNRAIKRIKAYGTAARKKGSGRPVTVTTPANIQYVEQHAESQENEPGTHLTCRAMARNLKASKSSVSRISRRSAKLKSVKRLRSVTIPAGTRLRRLVRARALLQRFPNWRVKKIVFQDEKDFTLEVPTNRQNNRIYIRGKKSEVDPKRLYHEGNRQSLKLMVSCCASYNGVTKPFFIDPQQAKVTGAYYTRHLERDLLPECGKLYPENDYIFVQDGATSHTSNICQAKLKELRGRKFAGKTEWPPKSPDCNLLDYYFWNAIQNLVYEGRREPFQNLDQLKRRIRTVWKRAINMNHLRKAVMQFRPRLKAVVQAGGGAIEDKFG